VRFIAKRLRHVECLHDEHLMPPSNSKEAARRWGRFKNKDRLTDLLHEEQFLLCAYTELRTDEEGLGTHIEHVKPKSKYPALTFSYQNLVVSALASPDLAKPDHEDDVFAGHAKKSCFDRKRFISPLRSKSKRNYFLYLNSGKVVPSPDKSRRYQKRAEHTINSLNLNASYLVNLRKCWIEELDQLIDDHLDQDMSLYDLAAVDIVPLNQRLSRFFTATRQRFEQIAEQVLKEQAPELL